MTCLVEALRGNSAGSLSAYLRDVADKLDRGEIEALYSTIYRDGQELLPIRKEVVCRDGSRLRIDWKSMKLALQEMREIPEGASG